MGTDTRALTMAHRPASASRNSWKNDTENIIFGVKKQMFGIATTATDLRLSFKKYDLARAGALDRTEFERAMGAAGLFLTTKEITSIQKAYGDESGNIVYEPFTTALQRGMNERRTNLVRRVYKSLDSKLPYDIHKSETCIITKTKQPMTMEFIVEHFDAGNHPKVRGGEISEAESRRQMKDGLENGPMDADGDGCVDEDEFVAFYNDISAGIPSDDYFVYTCECVWHIIEDEVAIFNRKLDSIEQLFVLKAKEIAKGNEIEEKAMFRVFKFFDADASGDLDKEEFSNAMKRFGIPLSQKQLDAFFLRYDEDGGGEVSYDEIIGRVCNSGGAGGFGQTTIKSTPWDTM